jgi:copper chaperone CopZ
MGSIGTAIIASLCCIGPAALGITGASGIGLFSAFVEYRSYFIGFTVILLGLAFYFAYRIREVKCEDGTCKIQSAGKWNKLTVWLATLIAVGALAFPYFYAQRSTAAHPEVPSGSVAVLTINGMDCKACASDVEGMLANIKGVRRATVDFDKERAVVEYNPGTVSAQTFVDRINETSYEASISRKETGQ